jgi:protein TonB
VRTTLIAAALALATAGPGAAQSGAPVYEIGTKGVTAPVLVREVKPQYPPDAKAEGVTGIVEMEGIVEKDGSIDHIRVTRSVDARLDSEAIKALAQWQFKPGTKDGEAVAVRVNVEMTFTIK